VARSVHWPGGQCHVAEVPTKARPTGSGVLWLAFSMVVAPLFSTDRGDLSDDGQAS
jgi:hypothetical protein